MLQAALVLLACANPLLRQPETAGARETPCLSGHGIGEGEGGCGQEMDGLGN